MTLVAAAQTTGLPWHVPAVHSSPVVQASPSLHVVWSGAVGLEQAPVPGSHVPATWH